VAKILKVGTVTIRNGETIIEGFHIDGRGEACTQYEMIESAKRAGTFNTDGSESWVVPYRTEDDARPKSSPA